MSDNKEKEEASKSNLSPEKDAVGVVTPATVSSASNLNLGKDVVASGSTDKMEEAVDLYEEEEEEEGTDEEDDFDEDPVEVEDDVEEKTEEKKSEEKTGQKKSEEKTEEKKSEEKTEEKKSEEKTEEKQSEDKTDEKKNVEELEASSKGKGRKPRKRNKNKKAGQKALEMVVMDGDRPESSGIKKKGGKKASEMVAMDGHKPEPSGKKKKTAQKASEIVAMDGDKPESSGKKKASKRVESMGMVFMCSSKTKADCFRYKILGLPASKKDQVAKIYKGMRLFLFDVDLRLMYGIFKAAGPGGYNIEPKAFKSDFPSQVRFTIIDDCLPLAEENFKNILKENYYTRNKFECQLNAAQVKKLCKLFIINGKGGPSIPLAVKSRGKADENHRSRADESYRSRADESYRSRADDTRRTRADDPKSRERRKRKRRDEEEVRRPRSPPGRELRRYHEYERAPVRYEREVLASPVDHMPRYVPLAPPAPAPPLRSFGYERALEVHPYVQDPLLEPRAYRVIDTEARRRDEIVSRDRERDRDRDSYLLYSREPPPYRDTAEYRHHPAADLPPEYRLVSREYPPPAVQPAEYRLSGGLQEPAYRDVGLTSEYRSPAASLYRPLRTHYRY